MHGEAGVHGVRGETTGEATGVLYGTVLFLNLKNSGEEYPEQSELLLLCFLLFKNDNFKSGK